MSSKRFKGKMLEKLSSVSVLESVVNRLKLSKSVSKVIIATSVEHSDNSLAEYCSSLGLNFFRGSLENVASRFHDIVMSENAPAFMRISGDSPLIDPDLIDKTIEIFNEENVDLCTNVFPRTFPKGQSIEILKSKTFLQAFDLMDTSEQLEHVTGFFYGNSEKFKILNVKAPGDYSDVNLCIDNPEDIEILEKVLEKNNGKPAPWKALADSYRIVKSKLTV
jgi:spore coat polysaccharide biosynthesis protein SpsF